MAASRVSYRSVTPMFVVAALALPPAAGGQSPVAEKTRVNTEAVAGGKRETDRNKLQGKWQILSIALEDKVFKKDDDLGAWKVAFENDLFVDKDRAGTVGYSNFKIKLDETREPKQVTIQDDDGRLSFRGIYALDGDALKICINGNGADVSRPEEFVTKKGTPLILVKLKKRPVAK